MTYSWSGWEDSSDGEGSPMSPYVDWPELIDGDTGPQREKNKRRRSTSAVLNSFQSAENDEPSDDQTPFGHLHSSNKLLPDAAENSEWEGFHYGTKKWITPTLMKRLPELDDGTVIIGVIDAGTPLGHQRFLDREGKTRIVAAWQQAADRTTGCGTEAHLPYGRELLADQIDGLRNQHTHGTWVDEAAFNRATGVEDYSQAWHQRETGRRTAHGAFTLNAAAGFDPNSVEADKTRIIAVNLPSRKVVGPSARYLEAYVINGIARIVALADALWEKKHGKLKPNEPANKKEMNRRRFPKPLYGFPIVINFSFSKMAGRRDGSDIISQFIEGKNEERAKKRQTPICFVVPTGNENLERINFRMKEALPSGGVAAMELNVKPEDQSANYVEIHSSKFSPQDGKSPFSFDLTLPNGDTFPVTAGPDGQRNLLVDNKTREPIAAIYCRLTPTKSNKKTRAHYVFCTRQTNLYEPDVILAPAGLWRLNCRNEWNEELRLIANVQSDQSELMEGQTGLQSYFDEQSYKRFDEETRVIDTHGYEFDAKKEPKKTDSAKHVLRRGAINAMASVNQVFSIAAFRASDGRPSPYSGSGSALRRGKGRGAPTFSAADNDSATMFGTLGAGSRDGSVVAMRGTSFAAARISREMAILLTREPLQTIVQLKCKIDRMRNPTDRGVIDKPESFPGQTNLPKSGLGRVATTYTPLRDGIQRKTS